MLKFIFILFSANTIFLWMLLIATKKMKSKEEILIEDDLQMEYLKEFSLKKDKN